MGKAILAAIVTLIVGYLGMVVGLEFLGNLLEFGLLIAIAVMGALSSTSMTRRSNVGRVSISAPRAAAVRRLRSETRLRAQ